MTDTGSESRRSLLGLAGLASLCCIGPGAAAVGSGATAGALTGGFVKLGVTLLTLTVIAAVLRRRTTCEARSD